MGGELVVLATVRASAGKEAKLEQALREAAAPTLAMPGCLGFELLRSHAEPGVITAIERWASAADHDRHLQAPHVATLMQRFDGVVAAPPAIVEMRQLA
jgi:quinol monooxygenase YgiN